MRRSNLALATSPPRVLLAVAPDSARKPVPAETVEARPEWGEMLRVLGVEPQCLQRNVVAHRLCTFAGRFVDVATGKAVVGQRDFALGSARSLVFDRLWLSSSTYLGPLGHGWHHAYDAALACRGESVAVRFADGRVLGFDAPAGKSESVDEPEGLRLARDAYGFVLRDRGGTELRFVPHRSAESCLLASVRARAGRELRFGYDHRARLVRITSRGDRCLELAYDSADRLIAICGPDAVHRGKRIILVQYAYDARGNLEQAADALGQARRYEYARQLMVGAVDRGGSTAHFEWDGPDSRARCVRTWVDAGVRDRKLEYGEGSTVVRSSKGYARTFEHDGSVVFAARGDAGGWQLEDDGRARALRATDPLGRFWQVSFDSRGRVSRWVDAAGRVTRYQYRGAWLVGLLRPGERHARFAYDGAGNIASHTAENGATTRYVHDARNQLVSVTGPDGHTAYCSYDALGRLIRLQRADGTACELAYDAEGRVVRWKDALRDLRFTYQGTGQLSSRTDAGGTLCFEYDGDEELVGVVNELGREFRISRDARGRVVETVGFDGCARNYARDAAGRVVRVERCGCFSEYEWGEHERVVEVQHSDGAFEGYEYRADGVLVAAWNQEGAVAFEFDECDRVVREAQGRTFVASEHDAAGRRTQLQSSVSLDTVSERDVAPRVGVRGTVRLDTVIERDAFGRVCRIREASSGFDLRYVRDAMGRVVERSLPGGGCVSWQRDTLGRVCVVRYVAASGDPQREQCFEWDGHGRLRRSTDSLRGTVEYRYDQRGNLTVRRSGTGSYELRAPDAVGNVYGRDDRRDREYGPAGQLKRRGVASGEVVCRYDDAGQLVERREGGERVWRFEWNAAGLLRCVVCPDASEVAFGYDALGRRSWKRHRERTTRFVWDGERLLHELVEGEPVVTWLYDPDDGVPVAKLTGCAAFAVLVNQRGVPAELLDGSGSQLWAAEATITGEVRTRVGAASSCWLRWPGVYEDVETGLYCHNRRGIPCRYYDPAAGAYVCQGALAAAPSLRPYALEYALDVELATSDRRGVEPLVRAASSAATLEQLVGVERMPTLMAAPVHAWDKCLVPSLQVGPTARAIGTSVFLDQAALARERERGALEAPEPRFAEAAGGGLTQHELAPAMFGPQAEPLLER